MEDLGSINVLTKGQNESLLCILKPLLQLQVFSFYQVDVDYVYICIFFC